MTNSLSAALWCCHPARAESNQLYEVSQDDITMLFWQAILLEHITGDMETRYLYEILAEASLVFPGVFPVMWVVNFVT